MTVKPRSASRGRPRARGRSGVVGAVRAEPKMHTAGPEPRQRVEAVDELAQDAQRAPGVGLEEGDVGVRDRPGGSLRSSVAVRAGVAVGHSRSIAGRRSCGRLVKGVPHVRDLHGPILGGSITSAVRGGRPSEDQRSWPSPSIPSAAWRSRQRVRCSTFEYQGTTFYFCSKGCLLDFRDDPEHYLPHDDSSPA